MSGKKSHRSELELDEIFLDSQNLPGFEQERLEGRIEKPISKRPFSYLGALSLAVLLLFWYKAYDLEIMQGAALQSRAEANRLKISPLWPERGLILDRNGKVLAGNESAFRLVLESPAASEFKTKEERFGQLEKRLKETIDFPEGLLKEELRSAALRKENLILGIFYDWEKIDEIRREFSDLPLTVELFSSRRYFAGEAASHLLGYLGYPSENEIPREGRGQFQTLAGKTGIEEQYDELLKGQVGSKLSEVSSGGEIFSESVQAAPENGKNIKLTIDSRLQERVYESVQKVVRERGFRGGAALVLNARNGEVLSLVSYPGFNPEAFSRGEPRGYVRDVLKSESKPLFNRAASGLYPAGSVIKPLIALAALEEKNITPEKQILSTGSISIPNPFRPGEVSIFYDWKAHGWVDLKHALAVSSNVYFYSIGGGYGDVKGLGVKKIEEWAKKFGFGEKTGIDLPEEKEGFIPNPEWKAAFDKNDPIWRIGDTYNLSIGQGNLQVTPLQMASYVSTIANGGKILEPHLLKAVEEESKTEFETSAHFRKILELNESNLAEVKAGMRLATEIGTAQALSGLGINVAGKTGTAEIGSGKRVNSWFIGFFPYEKPEVAMAVVLEGGSAANLVGAPAASRQIVEWISVYGRELLGTGN